MEFQPEWASFEVFLADIIESIGPRPPGRYKWSIDRIDNTKGYVRGNVRWANQKTQIANREVSEVVTMNGRSMCVLDWCKELGHIAPTVYGRINLKGMTPIEALTMPIKTKIGKHKIDWNDDTVSLSELARQTKVSKLIISNLLRSPDTFHDELVKYIANRKQGPRLPATK